MANQAPRTLSELLARRALENVGTLGFLDDQGALESQMTYSELYNSANAIAANLLAQGLKGGHDIVVSNFQSQRDHILAFWGCCLAGIPICPTSPLHPDPSRRLVLLNHLQSLFHQPVFIAEEDTLNVIKESLPEARTLTASKTFSPSATVQNLPCADSVDTVAIMLTSGSTGNSKGVVLTHATIIASIQGKVDMNGTTSKDVFLNWINFDHVANVTEVHLCALWAGASQYHSSPQAILSRPVNFLEWSARYKVTQTFSPNFLLAQICRNPSSVSCGDLSALRVVVTGGEANPVKTAVEFSNILEQHGAARTVLRSAFGMTETGAGSIYNLDGVQPSVNDYGDTVYLPVGKPHSALSVRIVDPESDETCPVGTVGRLQVSGDCVFNHYYRNPSATQSSFTKDGWFITGDLGMIDEDHNLVMLGRSKDDININGVKYLSVDLEHHIADSAIEGVDNGCIYACAVRTPGASTESYALFYRHASISLDHLDDYKDVTALRPILAANKHIKNACIVFIAHAPTVVLPLPSRYLVKTALGKVSRAALAKAYEEGQFQQIQELLSSAVAAVHDDTPFSLPTNWGILVDGVAQVFEIERSEITPNYNLFDGGASSMHLVRLKQYIQEELGVKNVAIIELLKRPVLADLASYIDMLQQGTTSADSLYNPLVCFNSVGTKPPLYLVHPGVGEVLIFINLARVLNDDRPVYALRARGFEAGELPPSSMQEMVEIYTGAVERSYPEGPYLIAGYSFGGAIAVEIAKLLKTRGKRVQWVGILNLPPFIQFRIRELSWSETLLNLCMFLGLFEPSEFYSFKSDLLKNFPEAQLGVDSEPSNPLEMIKWTLAHSNTRRFEELRMSLPDFHRWVDVAYRVSATGRDYEPNGVIPAGLTTVFCAIPLPSMGTRETYKRDRLSQWKSYIANHFEMVDVDGEHYTMISEEHCETFALHMREAIHRSETLLISN